TTPGHSCRKALHSAKESSSSKIRKETRPKKPVLLRMFLLIQAEFDPDKMRTRFGFFLKCRSHAVFSFGKKVGSFDPIQVISSKIMSTGLSLQTLTSS